MSPFSPSFLPQAKCVSERPRRLPQLPTTPLLVTGHESQATSHAFTSHKSRVFISLPSLCRSQKSQLLCNQANPSSFAEIPGVGCPHALSRHASLATQGRCFARHSFTPILEGPSARGHFLLSTFRINTCKSVSKQTTLTPFRINTCEKTGGGRGGGAEPAALK